MSVTVAQLQRLRAIETPGTDRAGALPQIGGGDVASRFQDTLQRAIQDVDSAQKGADQQVSDFVSGKQENLHEVMLSLEQAKSSFQLMVEVRNRVLETYQELSRMQV